MGKHDRQSFLGSQSEERLQTCKVGLVGLGGGGSHLAQQLAHVGFRDYVVIDPDIVEETNLNRLVGATAADVKRRTRKVDVARRIIAGLVDSPVVDRIAQEWQTALDQLKGRDVVIGALDSVAAKEQLDRFCKRYGILYIDLGMDVHKLPEGFLIAGQVVLTSPGGPCLRCLGVVTDAALANEAERYGAAGSKPQVVWPNGVLASLAVGLLVQQFTPWHKSVPTTAYLEYDGNKQTVRESPRLQEALKHACRHCPAEECGDALFKLPN